MSANPIVTRWAVLLPALALFGAGAARVSAAPAPLVLLFPGDQNDTSDAKALVALRTALRKDGHLEAISFDPDAPALLLAASDAQHPEWLSAPVSGDAERLDIARAVGAAYAAVVTHGGHGKADVHLLEVGPAARAWTYSDESPSDAVSVIARDAFSKVPTAQQPPPSLPLRAGGGAGEEPPLSLPLSEGGGGTPPSPVAPSPVAPSPVAPSPVAPSPVAPAAPNIPGGGTPPGPASRSTLPEAERVRGEVPVTLPSPVSGEVARNEPEGVPVPIANPNINRNAADLAAVQPTIATADRDVQSGDYVDAYALYRQAINLAPLSDVPRLKLAQAYLQGGQPDLALSEARRALEVVPDSAAVQAFLTQYDKENGTAQGKVARDQAGVIKNPQDPGAHLALGDALWSQGKDADAEAEFSRARDLAPVDSLARDKAAAHLAGLHTAMGRYEAALSEMQASGGLGYPMVLTVVQNVMDGLAGDLDRAQDQYATNTLTRADLYGKVQADEAQAQALADFVAKITPPAAYAHSHLDRVEATSLFSQAAAVLAGYLETNDDGQHEKAAQLEKDAQTEMLTAHAAEQKLGLWNSATRLGEDSR